MLNLPSITRLQKPPRTLVILLMVLVFGIQSTVWALPKNAFESFRMQHPWYDPEACEVTGSSVATTSSVSAAPTEARDKLAMLLFVRANTTEEVRTLANNKAGGIFVRGSDANDAELYNSIKSSVTGSSPFIAVDFEGGRVQAPGADLVGDLPSAQEMGQMSADDIKALAKEKGSKLAAYGINMDFAPTVDIGFTNSAVIGDRAFSDNPDVVSEKAGAFAAGLSESNVISTLKHFPGHGSRDGDSHTSPVATGSLSELEGRDLKPYQALQNNAKTAIMMGHLLVPEWGGIATSLNPAAYEYLRQVMNFNGVVVTDALDMQGVGSPSDQPGRAVAAIKAGADSALITTVDQFEPSLGALEQALENGEITQSRVDEAIGRLVALRTQVGSAQETPPLNNCGPCPAGTGTGVPIDGENPRRLFEFLVGNGLTKEQAAGVTGAIMVESTPNIDPTIVGGAGNNYKGIAQWDLNRGGRWEQLVNWATINGKDPLTFEAQVEYMWKEANERMNGPNGFSAGPSNIDGIKQQPTVELSAWYWTRFFEVALTGGSSVTPMENAQALPERIAFGYDVLEQYGNSVGGNSLVSSSGCAATSGATIVGDLAWPLPISWWQQHPEWFTKPHHDYPAADIPVPPGTAVYSMTSGVATRVGGDCGEGVLIDVGGGVSLLYCHGTTGSMKVTDGQTVTPGQELFSSGNTGNSTGPHLHLGLNVNGTKRCPQEVFVQMGEGATQIDLASISPNDCFYGSNAF